MNKEEFDKLPIGTILYYENSYDEKYREIAVKINRILTLCLNDIWPLFCEDSTGDVEKIVDYYLNRLEIAPKWIQKLFEVER